MQVHFNYATPSDAIVVARLVEALTTEICNRTNSQHFDIDLEGTTRRCKDFLENGYYSAILGFYADQPVALATLAETYALYAGGKIGVIQEFYVTPVFRSRGVGEALIAQVRAHGERKAWACMELCTPPLPAFERTLAFYQSNGLMPVGGRKMRQSLESNA